MLGARRQNTTAHCRCGRDDAGARLQTRQSRLDHSLQTPDLKAVQVHGVVDMPQGVAFVVAHGEVAAGFGGHARFFLSCESVNPFSANIITYTTQQANAQLLFIVGDKERQWRDAHGS
jgi:hypothetical protein